MYIRYSYKAKNDERTFPKKLKFKSIVDYDVPEDMKPIIEFEDLIYNLDYSNIDIACERIDEMINNKLIFKKYVSKFLYNEVNFNRKKLDPISDIVLFLFGHDNFIIDQPKDRQFIRENILNICMNFKGHKEFIISCKDKHDNTPASLISIYNPGTIEYDIAWDKIEDFQEKFNNLKDDEKKYIEYAILSLQFGSIQIFKFLHLNGLILNQDLCKHAIRSGNLEIIHILADQGFTFNNLLGESIKYRHHKISDWIIENYECEYVPIYTCFNWFNMRSACFLIANKVDLNDKIYNKDPPLGLATKYEMKPLMELLVKSGATISEEMKYNPFNYGAKYRDYEFMDLLIKHKGNINCVKDRYTYLGNLNPLLIATMDNNMELFNYCINHGASVNFRHSFSLNPLICAIKNGSIEMVKILLEKGAYPNYKVWSDCYDEILQKFLKFIFCFMKFIIV